MKKICVFSDSHGEPEGMLLAVAAEKPDLVIHLGDGEKDLYRLEAACPDLPIEHVRGNCDWRSSAPLTLRLTVEGKRIFAAHGHEYDVKRDRTRHALKQAALDDEADILLFGHTHDPFTESFLGMDIMNPGTVGEGSVRTYGVITIEDGKVVMELRRLG